MMSPSAKSCHTTGLVKDPVVVPAPTRTSCHCWLAPPQLVYCTMLPPSAVEAPWTSRALPLLRLISVTYPSVVSWRRHCWFVPLLSDHWTTVPPSAVDLLATSSTLPESLDRSR